MGQSSPRIDTMHGKETRSHITELLWGESTGQQLSSLQRVGNKEFCVLFFAFLIYWTHLRLVPHICVSELAQHWFR